MKDFLQGLKSVGMGVNIGRYRACFLCFIVLFVPVNAMAVPSVVVSIKPLHSLVSAVMDGAGKPLLIVQGAGSEHGYQLRPADAQKLMNADIVFWTGPQMETFLVKPLQNLSADAEIIGLADAPDIHLLDMRDGGGFEGHEGHADHHYTDLHFWLDPQNAKAIVRFVADRLAGKDHENAALYRRNARAYERRLDGLMAKIIRELAQVRGRPFIVFHDAYQYFEKRFGMQAAGSITVSPEQAPGIKRITAIHEKVKKLDSVCIFSEPQFSPRVVQTVIEGTNARAGVLDPLGADISEGPEQYIMLIRNIAASLKNCLGAE